MTLQVRDVHFTYGDHALLRGATLDVHPDEVVCLLGPSGAGKSTLLRCIAGLETPAAGIISYDGDVLDGRPPHERRIGFMFQEPALFPHLNVEQNVAFGVRYRLDEVDEATVAADHLELVGLAHRKESRVDELSGGERQRVALARTLAAGPRAVLLDEPLSALDRDLRVNLGDRIRAILRGAGVPVLWVTHDEDEARRVADRVLHMHDGIVSVKP